MERAEFKIITTTVGNKMQAAALADAIVRARLAACVQFWPIQSTYWWKGRRETGRELILSCKTTSRRVIALIAFIKAQHSYEVPEIVVTPIETGHPAYLGWIKRETLQPRLTFPAAATRKRSSRKDGKS